ncbi:MAG TPA: ABC transporter ATP-binding protein [Miltoncostaeaceae bacterium]|jgi:putative ABC transport system ATP-binding protein|nr:ABC transporter ATP-binding protein [Miltoncostaeaceae bacterium]
MTTQTLTPQAPDATGQPAHPVVVARGLVRRYGDGETAVTALDDVSLAVEPGELVAVMGPSGSGKSTLMHILAGLDRPTAGEVWIGDHEITRMGDNALTKLRRRHIGFVFQFFNLLPTLTAEENIVLPTRIAGGRPDKRRLAEILDAVGLTDRRRHKPSQMSGGQQQRVAIARAMLAQPTVLFADEPTGNLDSRSGAEILELLRRSSEDDGQTTVMVTHDAHAATIADRVVFLADGRIVRQQGPSTATEVLDALAEVAR